MKNSIKNLIRKVLNKIRGLQDIDKLILKGLAIGDNFSAQKGCIIDPSHYWHIKIGNNVTLAPNVHILAHDASTKMFLGYTRIGKVNIGSNVFIGAGTIVLPGISIGDNVIIGAGSVVSRDIPSNVVACGNPIRVIKQLEDYLEKRRDEMCRVPCYSEDYTLRKNVAISDRLKMNEDMNEKIGYIV